MKPKFLKNIDPANILKTYHGLVFQLFQVTYVLDFILIHKKDKNFQAKAKAYHERGIFWDTVRMTLRNFRLLCMCRLLDPDSKNYFSVKEIMKNIKNQDLQRFYKKRYKKIEPQVRQVMTWRGNVIVHRTIIGQFGDFGGGKVLEHKDLLKIQNFLFDFLCWLECALYPGTGKISLIKNGYRNELKKQKRFIQINATSVLSHGLDWKKFKYADKTH